MERAWGSCVCPAAAESGSGGTSGRLSPSAEGGSPWSNAARPMVFQHFCFFKPKILKKNLSGSKDPIIETLKTYLIVFAVQNYFLQTHQESS